MSKQDVYVRLVDLPTPELTRSVDGLKLYTDEQMAKFALDSVNAFRRMDRAYADACWAVARARTVSQTS